MFAELPKEVATQKRPTEITWMLAALGALLAAGGSRCLDALEPLPLATAGGPDISQALPNRTDDQASGAMFWLSRNTFVGSYSFFSGTRRLYVSSP